MTAARRTTKVREGGQNSNNINSLEDHQCTVVGVLEAGRAVDQAAPTTDPHHGNKAGRMVIIHRLQGMEDRLRHMVDPIILCRALITREGHHTEPRLRTCTVRELGREGHIIALLADQAARLLLLVVHLDHVVAEVAPVMLVPWAVVVQVLLVQDLRHRTA